MLLSNLPIGSEVHLRITDDSDKQHLYSGFIIKSAAKHAFLSIIIDKNINKIIDYLAEGCFADLLYADNKNDVVEVFDNIVLGMETPDENVLYLSIYEDASSHSNDRRKWPRYEINWAGAFTSELTAISNSFTILNISKYGIAITTSIKLPISDYLHLRILNKYSKEVLNYKAQIVHRELYGAGIWLYGLSLVKSGDGFDDIIQYLEDDPNAQ